MESIGIRRLSQNPSEAIDTVQSSGQPLIITNHRTPVAILVPVDSAQVEKQLGELALAAAPEFVASRARADEAVTTGEVQRLDDVIARLDSDEPEVAVADAADAEIRDATAQLFGPAFIDELGERATQAVDSVAHHVNGAVGSGDTETPDEPLQHIKAINAMLFRALLPTAIAAATSALVIPGGGSGGGERIEAGEGAQGQRLAEDTVEGVGERMREINYSIIEFGRERGGLSLETYEAMVHGIVGYEAVNRGVPVAQAVDLIGSRAKTAG